MNKVNMSTPSCVPRENVRWDGFWTTDPNPLKECRDGSEAVYTFDCPEVLGPWFGWLTEVVLVTLALATLPVFTFPVVLVGGTGAWMPRPLVDERRVGMATTKVLFGMEEINVH